MGHAPIGHSHPRFVASSERPSGAGGAVGAGSAHIGEGTSQTNEIRQFVEDTGLAETMTRDRLSELWRPGGGGVPSGKSDDVLPVHLERLCAKVEALMQPQQPPTRVRVSTHPRSFGESSSQILPTNENFEILARF
jgi:hypothetical protein